MNANEQAFPIVCVDEQPHFAANGLSKRELFAAMALQGMLAAETEECGYVDTYRNLEGGETYQKEGYAHNADYSKPKDKFTLLRTAAQNRAIEAVKSADALLAELAKPLPQSAPALSGGEGES